MRQTWLGRLLETGAASPAERRLADQRGADFFTWFHLEPVADPAVSVAHGTWHAFRPAGEVFRPLVELGVLVDLADFIVETRLGLDRAFIGGRNGAFARDIAGSYLLWALGSAAREEARGLFTNIEDMRNLATPLITGVPLPAPSPDLTGAYEVFLGREAEVDTTFATQRVTLTNFAGPFPATGTHGHTHPAAGPSPAKATDGWLRIDVTMHG
jgi:hypothetical protein